jgi:pSer/pThr/pTyr-binding forkhead associated (FHA) protein
MSQLTVTVLQLGLLLLLWLFVLGVIGVLRRDLFGTRVVPRTSPAARPTARTTPEAPARPEAAPRREPVRAPEPAPSTPPGPPVPRSLVVTDGPLAGTTLPLGSSPVLIGRAPDCTLVLPDDYASSHHARLVPGGGRWVLEDLGSTNGTLLGRATGGQRVTGVVDIGVGSVIRIGRTVLELRR